MAAPRKAYKYSVKLHIHRNDGPACQLKRNGYVYINVCLLGQHQRTRTVPPHFPIVINQSLHFDTVGIDFVESIDIELAISRYLNLVSIHET
jgi:hypothetical protein